MFKTFSACRSGLKNFAKNSFQQTTLKVSKPQAENYDHQSD
jgi:hypothetical protein